MAQPSSNTDILASLVLLAAAVAALIVANSPLGYSYFAALKAEIPVGVGEYVISDPLKDWIKNALMAVFFVYVGLEIKAEFAEGALSDRQRAILPFTAAAGGMAMPAIVYLTVVGWQPQYAYGWAIPAATDIAFAVGVIGLLGRMVPPALKAFLLAVAVIDDLGAILIIAFVYTPALDLVGFGLTAAVIAILWLMNWRHVTSIAAYMVMGLVLWLAIYQSGVSPTLAGVIVALFVPLKTKDRTGSPLHDLAGLLKSPVNFAIMPVFAFANAGVPLAGMTLDQFATPVTLGIAAGLLVGKPIGIFVLTWATVKTRLARLPEASSWLQVGGVGFIAGIGFTMSLFIGSLAFPTDALMNQVRLGVLSGSVLAALIGAGVLYAAAKAPKPLPSA